MNSIIAGDLERIISEPFPWQNLKNKRILVLGISSFLGSYLTNTLLYANAQFGLNILIFGLCRNIKKANYLFGEVDENVLKIIEWNAFEDISDKFESDIIFHFASPAMTYDIRKNPLDVIQTNVVLLMNLKKTLEKWGSESFFYVSSSSVYGYSTPDLSMGGASEDYRSVIDFSNVSNIYTLSKQYAEMILNIFDNLNVFIVRPFTVYGPGKDINKREAMTDFVRAAAICKEPIILKSSGIATRSYIYVSDAIRGFLYVLFWGESHTAYNIGSSKNNISVLELAKVVLKCVGLNFDKNLVYKADGYNSESTLACNCSELARLGWKEKIDLNDGIDRYIKWCLYEKRRSYDSI